MSKTKPHRLGDLQLRILKALWDRREATVADVLEAVSDHSELAYTTIATMLRKMEARGLVAHRAEGRVFIYSAKVGAGDVSHGMTSQLVDPPCISPTAWS
jgi:predicted transcriptional regulator